MRTNTRIDGRDITAGDLTEIVAVEQESRTGDAYGGYERAWSKVADAWAHVEALYIAEREHQGALRAVAQSRVTMYADAVPGINETMRVIWQGKAWVIRGVRPSRSSQLFVELIVEAGASA